MPSYTHSLFTTLFSDIKQDVILPPYQAYMEVKHKLMNNGFIFNGSAIDTLDILVCFSCQTMSAPLLNLTDIQQAQYPTCRLCQQPAPLLTHIAVLYYQKTVSDLGGLWLHRRTHHLLNDNELTNLIEQAYTLKPSPCFKLRMDALPRMLVVEGNLGAGKSTLVEALKEHYKEDMEIQFMKEPVNQWGDVLGKYYNCQETWSLTLQVVICVTFIQEIYRTLNKYPSLKLLVADRSHLTGPNVFSKVLLTYNIITKNQFNHIMEAATTLDTLIPVESVFRVFLQQTPEVCATRVAKRARTEELTVPLHYLRSVDKMHKVWSDKLGNKCCTLHPHQSNKQTMIHITELALQGTLECKNGQIMLKNQATSHITQCSHPEHGGLPSRASLANKIPLQQDQYNFPMPEQMYSPISPPTPNVTNSDLLTIFETSEENTPYESNTTTRSQSLIVPDLEEITEQLDFLRPSTSIDTTAHFVEVETSSEENLSCNKTSQVIDTMSGINSFHTPTETIHFPEKVFTVQERASTSLEEEEEENTYNEPTGKRGLGARSRLDTRSPVRPPPTPKKLKKDSLHALGKKQKHKTKDSKEKEVIPKQPTPFLPHLKH